MNEKPVAKTLMVHGVGDVVNIMNLNFSSTWKQLKKIDAHCGRLAFAGILLGVALVLTQKTVKKHKEEIKELREEIEGLKNSKGE